MKNLPDNITEQEFVGIVNNITRKISHRYTFIGYESDDISQEAFIIAVEALCKYDKGRPLENFLYTHINNRLKNFKRDNYYRQETGKAQELQEKKKSILEPVDIHSLYNVATGDTISDEAHLNEIKIIINNKLPKDLRGDYLRMQSGCKITNARRFKVIECIESILGELQ